jgi:hypothetical protein
MPEVTIYTDNVVIPALGIGILFNGGRLEYLPQYFVQHLSVCLPLLIHPFLRNIMVLDGNREKRVDCDSVLSEHLANLRR